MMKYLFLLFLCLTGTVHSEDVNVLDFGAVPDGKTLATASLQNAIDHCSGTGGGTVAVPPGTYLTHTVYLKNGVNLHIQKGAVNLGDTDPTAFDQAVILGAITLRTPQSRDWEPLMARGSPISFPRMVQGTTIFAYWGARTWWSKT